MALDVSTFHPVVVADTCAVWNVLSSSRLHREGIAAGCHYCVTDFGLYECLYKPRKAVDEVDLELQRRLRTARNDGQFQNHALAVEDLQDVAVLEQRKRLSKGELAAIAFAKRTRQAFLTDDQGARRLAATAMDSRFIQTTPHLLGWLVFAGRIGDVDITGIVEEHERMRRPLKKYFIEAYEEGMRCRLMVVSTG
jgi:predicted nucleic acid-binding protein